MAFQLASRVFRISSRFGRSLRAGQPRNALNSSSRAFSTFFVNRAVEEERTNRYLPNTTSSRKEMCDVIGVNNVDELFSDIPSEHVVRDLKDFRLPMGMSEMELERSLYRISKKNVSARDCSFFVGCGIYNHHIPNAVDQILQRSEYLTSYTPYQPEVSQGTLQTLFEFQSQVAMLTGMEISNASMYDGATACAEAVLMASRVTKRRKAVLSGNVHPHYLDVLCTYNRHSGAMDLERLCTSVEDPGMEALKNSVDEETACVVVSNPDIFGHVHDVSGLANYCHERGVLLVVAVPEVLSLGAVKSPGEMNADIVAAEGQSLGNTMNFGGPTVGLLSCKKKYMRQMPGRLVGQTNDAEGNRAFVLTLGTREQHIRREKVNRRHIVGSKLAPLAHTLQATSNICTSAGLCALGFSIHCTLLGEKGLRSLAKLNHDRTCHLAERIEQVDHVLVLYRGMLITAPGAARCPYC
uniref:Glycine cleavage system P-protein N-terminal domain-containing protein n=1 Tax=Palpitomonas bilix TaxID=652834 RepID=A0A7S3DKZ5_9EUKA|mmetsp:Transcript_42660/g.109867  ORF Transcript_42660/g.109867 Transcript_42660/m.109867 type:complete len:467 (+) Transcript_42660:58-1458(+)